jgi:battenin
VPSPDDYWLLSKIIHSIRDYYPLWQASMHCISSVFGSPVSIISQLVYQTTVFLSRSSISLGLPPLPARLLSLPAFVQGAILFILAIESAVGIFGDDSEGLSFSLVFLLISIEGFCGGLA